eukprot:12402941-Prorocentrum_lima.AAC.1
MTSSLVGSEMCIRDSSLNQSRELGAPSRKTKKSSGNSSLNSTPSRGAVSYTHLTLPTICSV